MVALVVLAVVALGMPATASQVQPNVVYILSDDMRADWGAYGLPTVTPNLDELAKDSLLFEHAFCQISVCSPSRQSFLTSIRPDTNQVWNFIDANPLTSTSTPKHFKDHGYLTLGLGKTFHEKSGAWNADEYWSTNIKPYFPYGENQCPHGGEGGGHCVKDDNAIWDWSLRNETLEYLKFAIDNLKTKSQPFFLMTGFRDPHAPWAAPQRMYDLYNESEIKVATHKILPTGTPQIAWSHQLSVQLQNGTSFPYDPYTPVPDWVMQDQRLAYYAAVSYVDEHVGEIISMLKKHDVYENTIIIFHSDHGYHLGEHGEWEKKSNFDLVVRVPLMIRVPNSPVAGKTTPSFTDLVDVFPTVSSLAGLPLPEGIDGDDVSELFSSNASQMLKKYAYHQYPACNMKKDAGFNTTRGACNNVKKEQFDYMGYSVRTLEWRYTVWYEWDGDNLKPLCGKKYAEELYDHQGDDSSNMDEWENENLAAANPDISRTLRMQINSFFKLA